MTDKSKKDKYDGTGWKAVTRQHNWNMSKQEFQHRNRDREWILQDKKLKNSICRIHLYLLLCELHEEIQTYLIL